MIVVIAINADIVQLMESRQRRVDHLALRADRLTPNKGVLEDMEWVTFKLQYKNQLRNLDGSSCARTILHYLYLNNVQTRWKK